MTVLLWMEIKQCNGAAVYCHCHETGWSKGNVTELLFCQSEHHEPLGPFTLANTANLIQAQKGSSERLFILTQTHSKHIFGEIPQICILCVHVKINKRLFEPYCIWILF